MSLITTQKMTEIENKISCITGLVGYAVLNTRTTEIENKTPNITNLATKGALSTKAIETKGRIPGATSCITTPEFNRLTKLSFDRRIKEATKTVAT